MFTTSSFSLMAPPRAPIAEGIAATPSRLRDPSAIGQTRRRSSKPTEGGPHGIRSGRGTSQLRPPARTLDRALAGPLPVDHAHGAGRGRRVLDLHLRSRRAAGVAAVGRAGAD